MNIQSTSTARMARFGAGAVVIRAKGDEPLSLIEMEAATPSVFAETAHESRSTAFTHISTVSVLAALQEEGFHAFEVRQGGSRDVAKRSFTKHLLKLRRVGDSPSKVGDSVREVLLLNGHDGTTSYRLMSGVFRMVCSNGMIVADGQASDIRIRHKGDIVQEVIDAAYTIVDDGRRIDDAMANMRAIQLSQGEREAFAEAALHLRYSEEEMPEINPRQLLAPRRSQDAGNSLWATLNVAQEHLEHGGLTYRQRSETTRRVSHRTTRPVNAIDGSINLNRALWLLATRLQELKA